MVCINGSPNVISRTGAVVNALADGISESMMFKRFTISMSGEGAELLGAIKRDQVSDSGERLLARVENADLLVVGTPVYRASYTGILKHLFDMVDHNALRGRKAAIVATGGSLRHALMLEHQLRPLMGFFGLHVMPTTLYAAGQDFVGGRLASPEIHTRIRRVVSEIIEAFPVIQMFNNAGLDLQERG